MLIRLATLQSVAMDELREENPLTWFPLEPTDADLLPFGVARVRPAPVPPHDPIAARCVQGQPQRQPDGSWRESWEIIENPPVDEREWSVSIG